MTISSNYFLGIFLSPPHEIDTFHYLYYLLKVHIWMKTPVPDNHDDVITFIQRLASVGVPTERHMKQVMMRREVLVTN